MEWPRVLLAWCPQFCLLSCRWWEAGLLPFTQCFFTSFFFSFGISFSIARYIFQWLSCISSIMNCKDPPHFVTCSMHCAETQSAFLLIMITLQLLTSVTEFNWLKGFEKVVLKFTICSRNLSSWRVIYCLKWQ